MIALESFVADPDVCRGADGADGRQETDKSTWYHPLCIAS